MPVDLGADDARERARRELAKAVYQQDAPSPVDRLLDWLGRRIAELLTLADARSPGGIGGLLVLLAVVVVVVLVLRWRLGRVANAARVATPLFGGVTRSADEHRRAADAAAAAGRFDEAVHERMRALVRGLEERDLIDERPGRTAREAAREAARAVPGAAGAVDAAAARFDEIAYGGRAADSAAADLLRAADDEVRRARPLAPA